MRYIELPDGSYAAVNQVATFGDIVTIILLIPIVFVVLYLLWRDKPHNHH
jgi:hypothetical protein